ncbi:hemicentin-2 [Caerostris extrusa]|uniref:Hemicentin-2 n=1 Tax=Caerostris extrusa TaxID=172846 RepID=A0AAV4WVN8_CAEEX|nr:hemicentin-2 [Caerostris extrusa]
MISISVLTLSLLAAVERTSLAGEPPVVAAFNFPSALKEGERGSAICTIRSGDTPLEFQWLKDGQDVNEIEGIKIQSVMDSSFLVISSVTSKSSGNYTCIVKNSFGSDRYTSVLAVTGGTENSFISGDPGSSIQALSNGALSFSKIDATMQGSYTCIADNTIGTPLSKSVFVKVRNSFGSDRYTSVLAVTAPPTWSVEPKDIDTQEGENEVIHCEANGVPAPEIKWMHGLIEKASVISGDAASSTRVLPNGALSLKPPIVAPFYFPPGLKEGERGSAICTIKVRRQTFRIPVAEGRRSGQGKILTSRYNQCWIRPSWL